MRKQSKEISNKKRTKDYIISHVFKSQMCSTFWMKYDDDRPNKSLGSYDYVPAYIKRYINNWGESLIKN